MFYAIRLLMRSCTNAGLRRIARGSGILEAGPVLARLAGRRHVHDSRRAA